MHCEVLYSVNLIKCTFGDDIGVKSLSPSLP